MDYEQFNPGDLLITAYSAKPEGNFGPHRIPHGIRAIHLPTGTVASCDENRSQHKNRHTALTQLWEQVQGKPSYAELAAQVEVLKDAANIAWCKWRSSTDVFGGMKELIAAVESTPAACLAQVRAEAVNLPNQ
jgi:hypothetical protein